MEGIESFGRYSRSSGHYHPRRTDSRRCSPRLPTPEASRSSNGSLDEQIPRDYIRRGPPVHALLSGYSPARETTTTTEPGFNGTPFGREGPRYAAPQSPPYPPVDHHKPSLPPLKTVRTLECFVENVTNKMPDLGRHHFVAARYTTNARSAISAITMRASLHSFDLQARRLLPEQEASNRKCIRFLAAFSLEKRPTIADHTVNKQRGQKRLPSPSRERFSVSASIAPRF